MTSMPSSSIFPAQELVSYTQLVALSYLFAFVRIRQMGLQSLARVIAISAFDCLQSLAGALSISAFGLMLVVGSSNAGFMFRNIQM